MLFWTANRLPQIFRLWGPEVAGGGQGRYDILGISSDISQKLGNNIGDKYLTGLLLFASADVGRIGGEAIQSLESSPTTIQAVQFHRVSFGDSFPQESAWECWRGNHS
ncbi:hypothetical protein Ancab_026290 [Ancistrocladus abbreviatus]